MSKSVIAVGGGAAGITAAISAAACGHRVVLLEGNAQLGRKILISGNGRCNLTNVHADDLDHYHGTQPRFVRPVLAAWPLQQTLDFFRDLGLEFKEEKRGRLFPVSDQAQSVVELLEDRLQVLGVEVVRNARARAATRAEGGFQVWTADGRCWEAEKLVLASGGVSVAKLGADRSGIGLAEGLGHTATGLYPGLVPLLSPDPCLPRMQGVKVWAEVRAALGRGRLIADTDDLLFTQYGVSGFTILNLSARIVPLLERGPVELQINLFPGQTPEQLSEKLKARWERHPHRSLALSFAGLLHSKAVGPLLQKLDMPAQQPVARISKAQRWELARLLTGWSVQVTGPRDFDHAEVTIGGIRTSEIDPATLESHLVPGLYLAGELLDVHGDLGGFNFQWAWSSGAVAGRCG